jgi:hypothetical protein
VKMHARRGRPRKDGRTPKPAVKPWCPSTVATGPLSGEDALRLLESADIQERASVVARICRQVGDSGARREK